MPAMGAAQRHEVMMTPIRGVMGLRTSVTEGRNWLRRSPREVGAITTDSTDIIIPHPSTSTEAPAKTLTRRGVMKTAVTVDARVMRTDRGRSPPAMKVATLEACPPGQHDSSTSPVPRGVERFIDLASSQPRTGLTMYWQRYPMPMGMGNWEVRAKSSNVRVMPIESMMTPRKIVYRSPSIGKPPILAMVKGSVVSHEKLSGWKRAMTESTTVHTGNMRVRSSTILK
mmetsp:Transcript_22339/g.55034  ORF Transcript_22339/g.55034 Transcript_22339/m.55034 type:complete len:227 (-) Transcript_22339:70-750(-)